MKKEPVTAEGQQRGVMIRGAECAGQFTRGKGQAEENIWAWQESSLHRHEYLVRNQNRILNVSALLRLGLGLQGA